MEKTVTCLHRGEVKTTSEGEINTCRICGQETIIDYHGKSKIIKRGKINGVETDIHPPPRQAETSEPGEDKPTPASLIPPKPKKRKELEAYYESVKDVLLADYHSMLILEFLHKWHLSIGYWIDLKEKWNVVGKRQHGSKKARKHIVTVSVPPEVKDSLPQMPDFNDSWSISVQIEWFRTFRELRLAKKE